MTPFYALEILKNRTAALSLNHKIGSRDAAKQEVKEIVMCFKTHVIPTLEKALERAKKVEELLELYRRITQLLRCEDCTRETHQDVDIITSLSYIEWKIDVIEKELEEMK